MSSSSQEKQLEHALPRLKKGALLAQNPTGFENIPDLTQDDKYHTRREVTSRWIQSLILYVTAALCSMGCVSTLGSGLSFPGEFGIGSGSLTDEWIVG